MTGRNLISLQNCREFTNNVKEIASVVYQKQNGRKKDAVKNIALYMIELCIVLVWEKIPFPYVGTKEIECNTVLSKKRKRPAVYYFKVTDLCISLYAPVETHEKKISVETGVPKGKMIKEIIYDLNPFIVDISQGRRMIVVRVILILWKAKLRR